MQAELRRDDLTPYARQRSRRRFAEDELPRRDVPELPLRESDAARSADRRAELVDAGNVQTQKKYNGDRILVNKYIYTVSDPAAVGRRRVQVSPATRRSTTSSGWSGLPGETIRVFQGDLFTAKKQEPSDADFTIARKPPNELLAMRQLVHDTDYDPAELYNAGWPLRWQADKARRRTGRSRPRPRRRADGQAALQRRRAGGRDGLAALSPLRAELRRLAASRRLYDRGEEWSARHAARSAIDARPQLVTDFNAYNTRVPKYSTSTHNRDLAVDADKLGLHWVGDLMVEADVEVDGSEGRVDRRPGRRRASISRRRSIWRPARPCWAIDGVAELCARRPRRRSSKPGTYRVALANFDDQLLLWVDGSLVDFDGSTEYDADAGLRQPRGDHPAEPATPTRATWRRPASAPATRSWRSRGCRCGATFITSPTVGSGPAWATWSPTSIIRSIETLVDLPFDPSLWERFRERHQVEFPLGDGSVFRDGRQQPGELRRPAVARAATADRRTAGRRVSRTAAADRQGAVRLLAPFLEPHPRHADPVPAVSEFRGHEIGEIECQSSVVSRSVAELRQQLTTDH